MRPYLAVLVVFSITLSNVIFQGGCNSAGIAAYVKQICDRIPIHTTIQRTPGDNGFRIIIQGLPSPNAYRPGETYTVIINGSAPDKLLIGVMVEATATDKMGTVYVPGRFNTSIDGRVEDLKDAGICEKSVISHRYLMKKNGVKFQWTAPTPGTGCVHFNATVIEHSDVWYKDEGGLHVVICEEALQEDPSNQVNNDPPGQSEEECCACGHAMYSVEFQGLWSRNTHPKGFPDEKNSYQLHWSNVVGATHGSDYRIWDYGTYASRAVKEVCEYGSSRSLENEMKENSDKIRTVIKTKQLWGPEAILQSVKAVYTASKQKPFLSLITMIGPSPDWCLGISRQSMCTSNCTWLNSASIDLYPWDSGTDSRLTYLGLKKPTDPPELIHRLNSTYPKTDESPFYGVELKPFARLTITKNKETCTDDDGTITSAEESPTTDELVSMMKKKMMMNKKLEMEKCATSQWSDWSDCSSSCGTGFRERRRMLKNPGITADMCDLELQEREQCNGDCRDSRRKKLSDHFVMRHDEVRDPKDMCGVTGWSDWSPCSATCGLGMKERWRMFLHSIEKRTNCGVHLVEKDLCRGEIPDCQKAMMMKNFTAICQYSADVGPCRGDFPRWFYNHTVQKCQKFSYGGCRGNENRFETEEECVDLCAEYMADTLRRQMEMEKQKQMEMDKQKQMEMDKHKQMEMDKQKQMEMDKQKQMEMDKQKQMEMDKQRQMEMDKQKQMEMDKQKQMEMDKQKQMEDDQTTDNDDLKNAMMKKQMMQQQGQGNILLKPDLDVKGHMSRRQQVLQSKKKSRKRLREKPLLLEDDYDDEKDDDDDNGQGPVVDCMMSPWSDWSECSVTCGVGLVMKQRMIKVEPQNGGQKCKGKLVKKKKCRQKKCPVDCEMGEWSEWSPCSETCGNDAVQIRKRPRLQRPLHGGLPCPEKLEKKFCNVPMCTGTNVRNNDLGVNNNI